MIAARIVGGVRVVFAAPPAQLQQQLPPGKVCHVAGERAWAVAMLLEHDRIAGLPWACRTLSYGIFAQQPGADVPALHVLRVDTSSQLLSVLGNLAEAGLWQWAAIEWQRKRGNHQARVVSSPSRTGFANLLADESPESGSPLPETVAAALNDIWQVGRIAFRIEPEARPTPLIIERGRFALWEHLNIGDLRRIHGDAMPKGAVHTI